MAQPTIEFIDNGLKINDVDFVYKNDVYKNHKNVPYADNEYFLTDSMKNNLSPWTNLFDALETQDNVDAPFEHKDKLYEKFRRGLIILEPKRNKIHNDSVYVQKHTEVFKSYEEMESTFLKVLKSDIRGYYILNENRSVHEYVHRSDLAIDKHYSQVMEYLKDNKKIYFHHKYDYDAYFERFDDIIIFTEMRIEKNTN